MHPSRHIPLQGASNFRDFGGYPARCGRSVKWRRLFRSDRLCDLTAADHHSLAAHGIRFVYDLRRPSEALAAPTHWPGEEAPELIGAPLFDDDAGPNTMLRVAADEAARHDAALARAIMKQTYVRMVTEATSLAAFRLIFSRLAAPGALPALFHCAGGKDRTGVTCALILSALGVSRDDIAEDFMLTQRYYDAAGNMKNRVRQVVAEAETGFWSEEALAPIFGVQRLYIETALDIVAAAGGIEAFLADKVGVGTHVLERLRGELLA